MADPPMISIGISKRKKSFKPTVKSKKPKPIAQNKEIAINSSNADSLQNSNNSHLNSKSTTDHPDNTQVDTFETNVDTTQSNTTADQVQSLEKLVPKEQRDSTLKNITASIPIVESTSCRNSPQSSPVITSNSVYSSPEIIEPMTIQDLNSFTVKANQKNFDPSQPRLQSQETRKDTSPWFLRPISDIQKDSEALHICGYRIEKDKIPSEEYLKDLTEKLKARQQELFPPQHYLKNVPKKRTTKKKLTDISEQDDLSTISLRNEKLLEISKYDANLEDIVKDHDTVVDQVEEDVYTTSVVPQVKIVNGEIVLDEDSLVVERKRIDYAQQANAENSRAPPGPPVTNRSQHYAQRNSQYVTRKWSALELQVFYDGLTLYGTDFTKIANTIPEKDRFQVKNKYKAEEKKNPSKINEYLMKGTTGP